MRVGFNGTLLSGDSLRGWNRYLVNLIVCLSELDIKIFVYARDPIHESHLRRLLPLGITFRTSDAISYSLWEQLWLSRQIKSDRLDVFHTPVHYGLPVFSKVKKVLTLHDAIDENFYRKSDGLVSRCRLMMSRIRWHEWIARRVASRIFTVSEFSKADLIRTFGIRESRIDVIPEAADPCLVSGVDVDLPFALDRPFALYVGGYEKRKNVAFLLQAWERARVAKMDLVLAGDMAEHRPFFRRLIHSLGIGSQVHIVGRVTDEQLATMYRKSKVFVYPSLYEGFGLQACESIMNGRPVLFAEGSSLAEVVGSAGAGFSLDGLAPLSKLLARADLDDGWVEGLAKNALSEQGRFSWQAHATKTLERYRSLF